MKKLILILLSFALAGNLFGTVKTVDSQVWIHGNDTLWINNFNTNQILMARINGRKYFNFDSTGIGFIRLKWVIGDTVAHDSTLYVLGGAEISGGLKVNGLPVGDITNVIAGNGLDGGGAQGETELYVKVSTIKGLEIVSDSLGIKLNGPNMSMTSAGLTTSSAVTLDTEWDSASEINAHISGGPFLITEVDGSVTNEIEVVDETYNATNFNGGTTSAVSQDDFYDHEHLSDSDDDGLPDKVDLSSAGFVKTDASGNVSSDGSTYLTGNQTITLSGDVDGSGTNSITTTIDNYSHLHRRSEIDTLQMALDSCLKTINFDATLNTERTISTEWTFTDTLHSTKLQLPTGAVAGYYIRCKDAYGNVEWVTLSASQVYKGTWNATTNSPTLANGSGMAGWFYRCVVAGTTDFGAGGIAFVIGDDASYNGSIWEKIPGYSATPAALTKSDDTNITLTLGGDPTHALLQATSITAGWTGTLADERIASAATWNAKLDQSAFDDSLANVHSANLSHITNLTTNGIVTVSGSNGTLGVDSNTYLTTETGDISAVTAGDALGGGGTTGAVSLALNVNANGGLEISNDSAKVKLHGSNLSLSSSGLTTGSAVTLDADIDTQGEVETIWGVTLATDTELSAKVSRADLDSFLVKTAGPDSIDGAMNAARSIPALALPATVSYLGTTISNSEVSDTLNVGPEGYVAEAAVSDSITRGTDWDTAEKINNHISGGPFLTAETGTISSVTAGPGLSGGGTTGAIAETLNVAANGGLEIVSDSVKIKLNGSTLGLTSAGIAVISVSGVTGANEDDVTLADVQSATSNDFHSIGGTDDDTPDSFTEINTGTGLQDSMNVFVHRKDTTSTTPVNGHYWPYWRGLRDSTFAKAKGDSVDAISPRSITSRDTLTVLSPLVWSAIQPTDTTYYPWYKGLRDSAYSKTRRDSLFAFVFRDSTRLDSLDRWKLNPAAKRDSIDGKWLGSRTVPALALPATTSYLGTSIDSTETGTGVIVGKGVSGYLTRFTGLETVDSCGVYWDSLNKRLGIGTTNPQGVLDVYSAVDTPIYLTSGVNDWRFVHVGADNTLRFQYNDASKVTFDDGGNVGIGTTSPDNKLHIEHGTNNEGLRITNTLTAAASESRINFEFGSLTPTAYISAIKPLDGTTSTNRKTDLSFNVFEASFTEAMRIKSNGNVGIGIATPLAQLHTTGTVRFAAAADTCGLWYGDADGDLTRIARPATAGWLYNPGSYSDSYVFSTPTAANVGAVAITALTDSIGYLTNYWNFRGSKNFGIACLNLGVASNPQHGFSMDEYNTNGKGAVIYSSLYNKNTSTPTQEADTSNFWFEIFAGTPCFHLTSYNGEEYEISVSTTDEMIVSGADSVSFDTGTKLRVGNVRWTRSDCDSIDANVIDVSSAPAWMNQGLPVDEAYSEANFNGGTTSSVSQDDFYDYNHIADTDDDGYPNKVDLATAGFVKTDASGILSADTVTYQGKYTNRMIIASPGADSTGSGTQITLKAHQNVCFGDACYINAQGEAQIGDADAIANASCVVISAAVTAADAKGLFFMPNAILTKTTWNWTTGALIYLSTAGTSNSSLTETPPSGSGDVIQILGVATTPDIIMWMPNLSQAVM